MSRQTIIPPGGNQQPQGKSINDMSFDELIEWMTAGRYEHYPSKIKHIPISEDEESEISYYDAMGRDAAANQSGSGNGSGGKTGGGALPWPVIVFLGAILVLSIAGAGAW